MAKVKTKWVCQNCAYETVSYLGKCPECLQFGTFVEETISSVKIESNKPSNQLLGDFKVSKIKNFANILKAEINFSAFVLVVKNFNA